MMNQKNNGTRTLAILTAFVALIGLGVGFAAFTRTLTISSSATVTPTNNFNVHWNTDSVTSGVNACTTSSSNVTASPGTVTETSITGVTASLKAPGDYAICKYEITNENTFIAYLRSITFANKLTCTAGSGTTASLVTAACAHIKATVQFGGTAFGTGAEATVTNTSATKGSNTSLSLSVGRGAARLIFVKIYYDNDTNASTELADGTFTVSPQTISFGYSTASAN